MDRKLIAISVEQPATEWWDGLIEGLLISLLAFMPLALGAVQAWSEQVVILLAAALSLVFLAKLTRFRTVPFVWSWAYVPVLAFVLVVAFQLLPLPAALVRALSPHTAALKTSLLGNLPGAGGTLSSMPLTFYSYATRHDLRLVLAVAAVFVVVVNVYREPARIKRLLAAIAIIGGALALLALAQDLGGNGRIYWLIPTYDKAFSGTFVNHSHYGQFMNLSMGAALGLLCVHLHEAFRGRHVTPARVAEHLGSPEAKTLKLLAAMLVLGAATVFVSLTRGGMVSMLIAAAFTTVALSSRRSLRGHSWVIVLLALGAFVCVLYVGFDQVYDRLATLREFHEAEGGRWQIAKDIASAWSRFPVLGTGLGTHQVVYPMFDSSNSTGLATHAENEYAQLAEETGLLGLCALIAFGVIIWIQYGRSVARPYVPLRSAAYGLGFGVLAILIHSVSDFGQHLPANAILCAVCCALLIAVTRVEPGEEDEDAEEEETEAVHPAYLPAFVPSHLLLALRIVALVLVAGVWTWALLEADSVRLAEGHWNKALAAEPYLDADNWRSDDDRGYKYLISHTAQAAAARPDNVQYRYWLNVYRWHSLARYADPNTGEFPPETVPFIRRIVAELHECRPLCPTFGPPYCVAGEIERFVLQDPNGADHIRQGYQLAPCDPVACLAAAQIDAEKERVDESFEKLCRAVQLDRRYFQRAARLCTETLDRADLAIQLAGNDTGRLAYVSNLLAAAGQAPASGAVAATGDPAPGADSHQQLAEQVEAKAFEQLRLKCEQPDAPGSAHASLADLYRRSGDAEAAIRQYRRALVKNYDQVGWHYALAQLLAQVNRAEEAVHEARICLRLRPDFAPAKKLIERLSARPAAAQSSPSQGR